MRNLLALLFVSTALAGPTWDPFGPGEGGWIEDVVAHATNPKEVWAMTDLSGLFRSQDAGLTWRKMSAGVERGVVARKQIVLRTMRTICDRSEDPRNMYWGACNMIWASHDGGVIWSSRLWQRSRGGGGRSNTRHRPQCPRGFRQRQYLRSRSPTAFCVSPAIMERPGAS